MSPAINLALRAAMRASWTRYAAMLATYERMPFNALKRSDRMTEEMLRFHGNDCVQAERCWKDILQVLRTPVPHAMMD